MQHVGLYEAKANLSKLAQQVNDTGEAVTITKRGEPFVDLVPHAANQPAKRSRAEVIASLRELRKTLPKTSYAQIRADVEEGRL